MLKVILRIFLCLFSIKIFNRNNDKISYSCIDDIKNIISGHNKEITNFYNETNGKTCNCRNKSN